MDPLTMLILGGGFGIGNGLLGIGSSLVGDSLSSKQMKRAYGYQKKLLQQQQDFYKEMSNTAHQREVADLRAAGLNPILSAGGSGASSAPVSAPGAISSSNLNPNLDVFSSAVDVANTLSGLKTAASTRSELDSQAELNKALADKAAAETKEIQAGLPLNRLPGAYYNSIFTNSGKVAGIVSDILSNIQEAVIRNFGYRRTELINSGKKWLDEHKKKFDIKPTKLDRPDFSWMKGDRDKGLHFSIYNEETGNLLRKWKK